MTNHTLDKFDQKIIDILRKEGRISNLDLSERVGLSPTPCNRRVKQLEAAGIIEGYTVKLNPRSIGLEISVIVTVRLEKSAGLLASNFANEIRNIPEIFECYLVTGNYDYVLKVRTSSVESLKDFMVNTLTAIPGVAETSSMLILEDTKVL